MIQLSTLQAFCRRLLGIVLLLALINLLLPSCQSARATSTDAPEIATPRAKPIEPAPNRRP